MSSARIPATPKDDETPPAPQPFTASTRSFSQRDYVLSLRDRRVSWQNIARMTGVPQPTLKALYGQPEAVEP